MKQLLRIFFCAAVLLAGIVLVGGTASAHTMPESEAVLIYPRAQGDMDIRLEFRCGMPLEKVEAYLGSNFELLQSQGSDFRTVSYKYRDITFSAKTSASSQRPPGNLRLTGIESRNRWFRTPSGFCVGDDFEKVEAMYGRGRPLPSDSAKFEYDFSSSSLIFTVDDEGRIEEIGIYAMIGR